jgi:hypothetical protein
MNIWNLFVREESPITKNIVSKVLEIELIHNELEKNQSNIIQQNKELKKKINKLEVKILDITDRTNKLESLVDEHIKYNIHYRNIINHLLQKKLI